MPDLEDEHDDLLAPYLVDAAVAPEADAVQVLDIPALQRLGARRERVVSEVVDGICDQA